MFPALASARLGVALAAALVALALTSAVADAATYTVWSCRGPDGAPLSTGAWSALGKDGGQDGCSSGGSLNARIPSGHDEPYAKPYALDGYRFALPEGALIAGYRNHLYAATAGPPRHWLRQAGIDSDAGSRLRVDAGLPRRRLHRRRRR